jgi:anaerobic selenocysteine-containing dehydrogenase
MHPADAVRLGVAQGETVRVTSRRGEIDIALAVTERVPQGTLFATFHSSAVNALTIDTLDALAKVPELKFCAVKVEKAA